MSLPSLKSGAIALTSVAAITAALALKYPDCALFDEHREGIPHPKGSPLVGNLLQLLKNKERIFMYSLELYEELDTLTYTASSLSIPRCISTVDPRNIEHILKDNFHNYVKSKRFHKVFDEFLGEGIFNVDGDAWKIQRKAAAQIFHAKNIQNEFISVFIAHVLAMCKNDFQVAAEDHSIVDFHKTMFKYTMGTFIKIGFGLDDLDNLFKDLDFAKSFDEIQFYCFQCYIFPAKKSLDRLKNKICFWNKEMTADDHMKVINDFTYGIIKERRLKIQQDDTQYDDRKNLLDRFMAVKKADGEVFSDQELRDIMLSFIMAGRDTSAQSLSWLFYNLMKYPHVEERLLQEVRTYMTDDVESDPTKIYEALQKMTYAHAVFREVLRLYPVVPGNQREALNDDIWPDGTHIRKGDGIAYHSFCQARLEKLWGEDAKEFKPERWILEDGSLKEEEPGMWTVFHIGPRICLGKNMATHQVLITMSMLLKRFKFERVPGHVVEFSNQVTLSMKGGMKIYVEKRQN